jgi:predicted ABC-type ATPase
LASKTFAPWIRELRDSGYEFHLCYIWLASPEYAVNRVARRVRQGGHSVPEETIHRRYEAGLRNLFRLYRPSTTSWELYDNSVDGKRRVIAEGISSAVTRVFDENTWEHIERRWFDGR